MKLNQLFRQKALAQEDTMDPRSGGVYGIILQIFPDRGECEVKLFNPPAVRVTKILHPFSSMNGWHRVMPDAGTTVVGIYKNSSDYEFEIVRYLDTDEAGRLYLDNLSQTNPEAIKEPEKYNTGKVAPDADRGFRPYRVLQATEQEAITSGDSGYFLGNNGVSEMFAGPVCSWWDKDELEIGGVAPNFLQYGLDQEYGTMKDTYSLGTVKRPKDAGWNKYSLKDGEFAKEEYLQLSWAGFPSTILKDQQGHVHEDDGSEATGPTGDPLRKRTLLYCDDTGVPVEEHISSYGDWNIHIPAHTSQKQGYKLDIDDTKNGNFIRNVGTDELQSVKRHFVGEVFGTSKYTVHKDRSLILLSNSLRRISGNETCVVSGNLSTTVKGNRTATTKGTDSIQSSRSVLNVTSQYSITCPVINIEGIVNIKGSLNVEGPLMVQGLSSSLSIP